MQNGSGSLVQDPRGDAPKPTLVGAFLARVRRQIVAGLFLVLPVLITLWIVRWLYTILEDYLISPAGRLVVRLAEGKAGHTELPPWFANFAAPLLGVVGVVFLLYCLGAFARSRMAGWVDYLLLRVPVVKVIHNAVSRFFQSMKGEGDLSRFKRVVLVAFPQPGMRVPGFVTSSCRDKTTQKTILCVYVPTTPVPTSGYMLLIPEEEVTELDWDLEETIQAVVSFGITSPDHVRYYASSLNGQTTIPEAKGNPTPGTLT